MYIYIHEAHVSSRGQPFYSAGKQDWGVVPCSMEPEPVTLLPRPSPLRHSHPTSKVSRRRNEVMVLFVKLFTQNVISIMIFYSAPVKQQTCYISDVNENVVNVLPSEKAIPEFSL